MKVREAIPDPIFAFPPHPAKWTGMAPLVMHAGLANAAALLARLEFSP